ncbi:MAG: hypothetical protein H7333_10670 [Bdellovibrionales bacterium]|nr:hypothetical protein [Oligoflexia bacterium]
MIRPTIKKIEQVGSSAGYGKGFWALLVCLAFASFCLIHIETSRARDLSGSVEDHQVTVERLPSAEAQRLGVDSRNH